MVLGGVVWVAVVEEGGGEAIFVATVEVEVASPVVVFWVRGWVHISRARLRRLCAPT